MSLDLLSCVEINEKGRSNIKTKSDLAHLGYTDPLGAHSEALQIVKKGCFQNVGMLYTV